MSKTPHPAHHSDNSDSVTDTERKEFAITTNSANSHSEADHGDELANAPRPDDPRCLCGALADRNGLCRKCRARATWQRRRVNRDRRAAGCGSPSRRMDRGSSRPQDRRPGR
jgi:hypothetical protein